MKKEEKLVKEKSLIDKEKSAIKKAEDAIDSAKKGADTSDDKKAELEKKVDAAKAKKKLTENQQDDDEEGLGDEMGSVGCFYIVYNSEKDDAADQDLVLEVQQKDKYAPKNTGVYDVRLQTIKASLSKAVDAKSGQHKLAQQWKYDAEKKALFSLRFPEKALFEGTNKNLIVYNFRGLKTQKFTFYPSKHLLTNSVTMRAIELANNQQATAGAEVVTAKVRPTNGLRQKFRVLKCEDAGKESVTDVTEGKEKVTT